MPIRSNLSKVLAAVLMVGSFGCGSEVATLEFVKIDPPTPKIGDVTTVMFNLTDYRGTPLAGQNVSFRLDSDKPGVTLSPANASSLKGSGIASTQIVVASRPTSVIVIAKAGDKEVRSPPISFAGAAASGRQFTFQCGQLAGNASGGRHAIGAYDQSRNLIAGVKLNCTAHVGDRNGDGVPGASVSFLTEAGAIGPSDTTVADVVGNATILYKTSLPLPVEVGPDTFTWTPMVDDIHTGAYLVPLWMEPYTWTTNPLGTIASNTPALNPNNLQEPRRPDPFRKKADGSGFYQNNPRDNLVSLIAFTSGEEGYTDVDNDGKFNAMVDIFSAGDDLTEPFVDSNDDGTCNPNEKYIDFNGNTHWDGKNGNFDQNTLIWAQERIIWTGIPDDNDSKPPFPTIRGVQGSNGGTVQISCFGGASVDFAVADPWFNTLARNSDGDGCKSENGDIVKVVGGSFGSAFTYPPMNDFFFTVLDALDRKPAPMTNTPGCFPPPGNVCSAGGSDCYTFEVPVSCTFTASPNDGYIVALRDSIRGRIFKNFP